ncbi:hypothetical protein ACOZ38_10350 [Sphaerisporangium viridialbum]|uniref:hypothetical protein n=1 Tax=Sphaerisporangium viridialbum TaxID=46189 RepID=UPI003C71ED2C
MNHTVVAAAAATSFLWLGMVLAISGLEAPLKFRAPGVSLQVGLSIGRLVFRALNRVEMALAAVVLAAMATSGASAALTALALAVVALLAVQVAVVRPRLNRRSDRVLAGEEAPRSRAHHAYIALEGVKIITLTVLAVMLIAGLS